MARIYVRELLRQAIRDVGGSERRSWKHRIDATEAMCSGVGYEAHPRDQGLANEAVDLGDCCFRLAKL